MMEMIIKINNESGLHARPAAILVNGAKSFTSNLTIKKGNREVNLKSLISLLSLGICKDDEVVLKAQGEDEQKAISEIIQIINNLKD
jgi:phosphotransferase system HPr (HPr) family protein